MEPLGQPDHEIVPQQGTVYSVGPRNAGRAANLLNPQQYPVEAVCKACGRRVVCLQMITGEWQHQDR